MAGSRFPETGLQAVLEIEGFLRDWKKYNQALGKLEDAEEQVEKKTKKTGKAIEDLGDKAEKSGQKVPKLAVALVSVNAAIGIATAAVGLITDNIGRLTGTIVDLAARGQEVTNVGIAFERIMLGTSVTIDQLRSSVGGAVSDLELMRLANVALINTEAEIRTVLAPAFGDVLQAAMAGAAATGQNLDIVLNKVILGIRRQSNVLLDDIGIWVDATIANQRYADAHGLVATQLTETQKAAAFATEAIAQMQSVMDETGATGSRASQRIQAAWDNTMNTLAQSVTIAFEAAAGAIEGKVTEILGYFSPNEFVLAGANLIAGFAEGIIQGARFVVQAVQGIANIIADFLMAFSPPKKGPLAHIDQGGENLVRTWLEGFARVSLGPVESLAQSVADTLNSTLGLETRDQVTVIEKLFERVSKRLNQAITDLTKGVGDARLVRALDRQREALAEQLWMLRERADLEAVAAKYVIEGSEATVAAAEKVEKASGSAARAAAEVKRTGAAVPIPAEPGAPLPVAKGKAVAPDKFAEDMLTDAELAELVGMRFGEVADEVTGLQGDMKLAGEATTRLGMGWERFSIQMSKLGDKISTPFGEAVEDIETFFSNLPDKLTKFVSQALDNIQTNFIRPLEREWQEFHDNWLKPNLLDPLENLGNNVINWFADVWANLMNFGIIPIRESLQRFYDDHVYPHLIQPLENLWNTVSGALTSLADWFISGGLQNIIAQIGSFINNTWTNLVNTINNIWNAVKEKLAEFVRNFQTNFVQPIENFLAPILDLVRDLITELQRLLGLTEAPATPEGLQRMRGGETMYITPTAGESAVERAFPSRQAGGFTRVGEMYLTHGLGRGKELFVPRVPGEIIPQVPQPNVNVNVNVPPQVGGNTINQNFHGPANPVDMQLALFQAQAMGVI